MTGAITLVFAVVCLIVAGTIAAAEAAFARVSKREAARWVDQGVRGASAVLKATDDPAPVINVAVFLRVLLQGLATALVTAWLLKAMHQPVVAVLVAAAVMGVLEFALVGVSPRTVGRHYPAQVAPATVPALRAITTFLGPVARGLVALTNVVTPGGGYKEGPFASDHELRSMVDMASDTEVIDADERRMVHAVFELEDTLVREVMVPRTDVFTVATGMPLIEAMRVMSDGGYSRVPVIGDGRDDVLGMLYFKDAAKALFDDCAVTDESGLAFGRGQCVDEVMRQAEFVPDSLTLERMLEKMQASKAHVAVLVDEYGGVAGLVTMEDIVEQIVGAIHDEHDSPVQDVEDLGDGRFRVLARTSISDVGELFDLDIEDDEVDTVGGLLAKALGKVPAEGDEASVLGVHLFAEEEDNDGHGLEFIIVSRAAKLESGDAEQAPTAGAA